LDNSISFNNVLQQEPWILDLRRHFGFKVGFNEAITLLIAPTNTNLGARDGSVKFENGTWGWVLSSPTGEELIKCKGPAYGILMDSF
jgi:hypothetical protein